MKGCREEDAACAVGALGTALSHDRMGLQLSRLAGCSLFSMLSVSFPFGKLWKKIVEEEFTHFQAPCLPPVVKGLMGEVATGLVTALPMGFAEFLSNELRSWSKIHDFGEYHGLHSCPVSIKLGFLREG